MYALQIKSGVKILEALPPRGATDAAFEECEADDGRGYAQEDVDGVVVAGIDGCPPDA